MLIDELRKLQAIISELAGATSEEAIVDAVVDFGCFLRWAPTPACWR